MLSIAHLAYISEQSRWEFMELAFVELVREERQ